MKKIYNKIFSMLKCTQGLKHFNMKKIILSVLSMILVISLIGFVVAEENSTTNATSCVGEGKTFGGYTATPDYRKCCEGLTSVYSYLKVGQDGKCDNGPTDGPDICIKCGNGICGLGENKCNCPKDCTNVTVTPACTDSDGGINYYVKGSTVEGGDLITIDNCNGNILLEQYCDGWRWKTEKYVCPNGCKDGACVKETKPVECKSEDDCIKIGKCSQGMECTCLNNKCFSGFVNPAECKIDRDCPQPSCAIINGNLSCPGPTKCINGKCVLQKEEIKEQVKCIFNGANQEQKCYTAEQNSRAYCSGKDVCVADISGYKGEKITWKSTCGGYAYTIIDGNNDYAKFDCGGGEKNITEFKNKGFKNVYFQCYDGEESKSTEREACKTADFWKKFAENFCASHCKKKGDIEKCGVNSFSLNNECYTDEVINECNQDNLGNNFCSDSKTSTYCGIESINDNGEKTYSFKNLTCYNGYCEKGYCIGSDTEVLIEKDIGDVKYIGTAPDEGNGLYILDYKDPNSNILMPIQVWFSLGNSIKSKQWCQGVFKLALEGHKIKAPERWTNGEFIEIPPADVLDIDGNEIYLTNKQPVVFWISYGKCVEVLGDVNQNVVKAYLKKYPSSCKDRTCLFEKEEGTKCETDNDCAAGGCKEPPCGSYKCLNGMCEYFAPEPPLVCKDSCPLDKKCYPFGYRKSGKYCTDNGGFEPQLKADEKCENNFECSSNVCVSGKCISEGFINKIMSWFKRMFGGG